MRGRLAFADLHRSGKVRWFGGQQFFPRRRPEQLALGESTPCDRTIRVESHAPALISDGLQVNRVEGPRVGGEGLLEYCRMKRYPLRRGRRWRVDVASSPRSEQDSRIAVLWNAWPGNAPLPRSHPAGLDYAGTRRIFSPSSAHAIPNASAPVRVRRISRSPAKNGTNCWPSAR